MKFPAATAVSFVLAALISAPSFANEAAAPAKADLAKGQEIATNVCAACHTAAEDEASRPRRPAERK